MVSQRLVITESFGLHLRPAGKLCDKSLLFESKILLKKGTQTANAKSVLGVLAARVQQGDEIELICEGPDEVEALRTLVELIEKGF